MLIVSLGFGLVPLDLVLSVRYKPLATRKIGETPEDLPRKPLSGASIFSDGTVQVRQPIGGASVYLVAEGSIFS